MLIGAKDGENHLSAYRRKDAHKFYESIGYANDVVKGFKKYL